MRGKEVQHRLSPGKRPLEVIQRADRDAGQAGAGAVGVGAAQRITKTDLLLERVDYHVDIGIAAGTMGECLRYPGSATAWGSHPTEPDPPGRAEISLGHLW